jgi:hypothetical protein
MRRAKAVPGRQRLPAELPDLQRTLDALGVVGRQARGGGGVHAGQFGVQGGPALPGGTFVQRLAHLRVGTRHGVQPVAQRLEVQHGAAHQQRQAAACADLARQAAVASATKRAAE